jgi:ArsR family transcriptional regulator, arsenate/arsenite/antimonite-responsive transcriptional repressor
MKYGYCKTEQSKENLKDAIGFLKIISEENRLKILCLLKGREMCVCDIWEYMELPQNLVSHHLKVLKDFQLVNSRREGTKLIYSANKKEIEKYYTFLSHYLK